MPKQDPRAIDVDDEQVWIDEESRQLGATMDNWVDHSDIDFMDDED